MISITLFFLKLFVHFVFSNKEFEIFLLFALAYQNLPYPAYLPLLGGRARVMAVCIFVKQHDEVLQFAMTTNGH